MQNYQNTLLSQYANSPTLTAILAAFNSAIDPSTDIQNLYSNIWNIQTAQGSGLDILGAIVGVSRNLSVISQYNFFGFYEQFGGATATNNPQPFGQAPFFSGTYPTTTYALSDALYKQLIFAKAFANISNLSVPSINQLLQILFMNTQNMYVVDGYVVSGYVAETGYTQWAYVADGGNMTYTVNFKFVPSALQLAILLNSGVFPCPCGVKINYALV